MIKLKKLLALVASAGMVAASLSAGLPHTAHAASVNDVTPRAANSVNLSLSNYTGTSGVTNSFTLSLYVDGNYTDILYSDSISVYRYLNYDIYGTYYNSYLAQGTDYTFDPYTDTLTIYGSSAIPGTYTVYYNGYGYGYSAKTNYSIYGDYDYYYRYVGGFSSNSTTVETAAVAGGTETYPIYLNNYNNSISSYNMMNYLTGTVTLTNANSDHIYLASSSIYWEGSSPYVLVGFDPELDDGDKATINISLRYNGNTVYNYNNHGYYYGYNYGYDYPYYYYNFYNYYGSMTITAEGAAIVIPEPEPVIPEFEHNTVIDTAKYDGMKLFSETGKAATSSLLRARKAGSVLSMAVFRSTESHRQVVIPMTMTYNGRSYSVTSIDRDAFEDDTYIRTVVIPSSVTMIGKRAFRNAKNLRKIRILVDDADDLEIEKNAFAQLSDNTLIIIEADNQKEGNMVIDKIKKAGGTNLKYEVRY